MLLMLFCLQVTAEVHIDRNKFGVVKTVMFTGYVMDNSHAKKIMNKLIGTHPWVGSGNMYRSGDLFMVISKNRIVVVTSHKLAMGANKYSTPRGIITKTSTRFGSAMRPRNWSFSKGSRGSSSRSGGRTSA